jgi:hypothetical protein
MIIFNYEQEIKTSLAKQKEVLLYLKQCGVVPKNGQEAMIHLCELNIECLKSNGFPMFDMLLDYTEWFGNDESIEVFPTNEGYLSDSIVEIIEDYAVIQHLKKPISI